MILICNSLMVYDVEHGFVFDYPYIFFWLSVCSDLYSFFMGLFKRSLSIFESKSFIRYEFCKYFSPRLWLVF